MKLIDTNYDLIAGVDNTGTEYIAIPVFEDNEIRLFKLPSGGTSEVRGLLYLPEDAEEISIYSWDSTMDDCEDADAVYDKCEALLLREEW